MSNLIDVLYGIWTIDQNPTGRPGVRRNLNISPQDVMTVLKANYSIETIISSITSFLFDTVRDYDLGKLSYRQGQSIGIGVRLRAILCIELIASCEEVVVDSFLLGEIIRSFPVLEWYHSIRLIIEARCSGAEVLFSLAEGLMSNRVGQIQSAAIGLAYYHGYPRQHGYQIESIEHIIIRIKAIAMRRLKSNNISINIKRAIESGLRHLDSWK